MEFNEINISYKTLGEFQIDQESVENGVPMKSGKQKCFDKLFKQVTCCKSFSFHSFDTYTTDYIGKTTKYMNEEKNEEKKTFHRLTKTEKQCKCMKTSETGIEEGMAVYLRILVSRFPFVSDSWQIINYYENIFTRKLLQVEFYQCLVLKSDAKWR